MKKENGITLISLVVYIIVMAIILVIMGSIIANFTNNTETIQANIQQLVEFNKFNSYFLKEVKITNNKVDDLKNNYILFTSGNSFSILNDAIYYNNVKICDGIQKMHISLEGKNIINVTLGLADFTKSIKYKLESIY